MKKLVVLLTEICSNLGLIYFKGSSEDFVNDVSLPMAITYFGMHVSFYRFDGTGSHPFS
jgi:hypothetical protein